MSFVLKLLLAASIRPARFIAAKAPNFTNGSDTVSYAGAQAGDLCVIWKSHQGTDVTGYSVQAFPRRTWDAFNGAIYWKVLTSGDISTGNVSVTTNGGCIVAAVIYRGPTTLFFNGTSWASPSSASSVTVPAFVVTPGLDMAVLSICDSQNTTVVPTAPAGATVRGTASGNGFLAASFADFIPTTVYPSGSTVAWGLGATGQNGEAFVVALR